MKGNNNKITKAKMCEACNKNEVQYILIDTCTYKLFNMCANCLQKLIMLRLTQNEFWDLLASGHTTDEYYLCEDYYNECGEALQPK